jgi:hypothetical protein
MLQEGPGGKIRLAAGVIGQSNIPGVMALPLGAIILRLQNKDGGRSELHGIAEMLKQRTRLR